MAHKHKTKKQRLEQGHAAMPLRIVGGRFRGHKLTYHGDPVTRPMKHRIREAIFNLVGPSVKEMHAIDLFAGTGALGIEAISRGAQGATFVERHFPTADVIEQNIEQLGISENCAVARANTFMWVRTEPDFPALPWLVLCSPPYDLFVEETDQMLVLISHFMQLALPGSLIVVESDARFDTGQLPDQSEWDVRQYPPSTIALYRKLLIGEQ
jgi:16S rRNA (guanine(966)-N(2))-methyltransferase RsmD